MVSHIAYIMLIFYTA